MTITGSRAVIWDMDGVIVDTAACHFAAWQQAFQRRGIAFTEDDFRPTFGQRNDSIIPAVMGSDVDPEEMRVISNEKEADYRLRIASKVEPLPGVIHLMDSLVAAGFRMALVSSAPLDNVQQVLESLGIEGNFQTIITAGDVTEGKPSPQGFIMAAQKLGVKPSSCIVIEDAVAGVSAARRGGMRCLAVTNTHARSRLAEADLVVDSLAGVDTGTLEQLIAESGR